MSEIERKVKAIIVEKLGVDESEVTRDAQFVNDLGADSLDVVEVIMEFEKEFGISIPDDKAEKIVTVGQAISYIEMATGAPSVSSNVIEGNKLNSNMSASDDVSENASKYKSWMNRKRN